MSAGSAGRAMSRSEAARKVSGRELLRQLAQRGIELRVGSLKGVSEEAPQAYKDVDEVAAVCAGAGLAARVARMRPLGVIKG